MQVDAGAVGVCATTGREATVFARAGLPGVLVTTPITQPTDVAALVDLHRGGADLRVVFDTVAGVERWERALDGAGRPLPAMADLNIGMGRTGAERVDDVVAIARRLAGTRAFEYVGLQAYSGRVQHIAGFADRREVYGRQLDRVEEALHALGAAGLAPSNVSGGGTGTFAIDVERGLFTESQAGSYCLMDVDYAVVDLVENGPNPHRFALHLRTSVVSANQEGFVSVNAGFKSLATDGPLPRLRDGQWGGSRYEFFGDEFGMIVTAPGSRRPQVGDIVDLQTSHCDPTINMHDFLHVLESDTLVDIWAIDARGVL